MTTLPAAPIPLPPIFLRSLENAEVLVGGQKVTWPARSAEELLWYLHAHPAGKYRHDIVAQLWNIEDTPAAANRFRVALHRLRGVLGFAESVTEHGGRYALHPTVMAASDTATIYRTLAEAAQAESRQIRERLLREALASAEGEYLPHLQGEWVEAARQQHRLMTVRAYLALATLHCEAHECQFAAAARARAAAYDPLIGEDHQQRLMVCLTQTRSKYAAIEHYRRYRQFLANEVGDTPMPDTEDLAERIKAGERFCSETPFQPETYSD